MKRRSIVLAAVLLLGWADAQAGSIWNKSPHQSLTPYADDTARNVGDLLTIVINERSVIDNSTDRQLEKKDDRAASVSGNIDLLRGLDAATGKLFSIPDMKLNSSASTKFDGKADYGSDRSMTDRVTVTVEDILPNGNLVVLGTRKREVDSDVQVIQISGIVRPTDVAFDNSVSSAKVSEFHIVYRSKGRENQFTKPGWLGNILNIVNPF